MIRDDNIPQKIKDFFKNSKDLINFKKCNLFFCRSDGIVLYHESSVKIDLDESSIGALIGGAWQAAKALTSFLSESDKKRRMGDYRFSFDTSQNGFYILPVFIDDKEYYFGIIFHNEINLGWIKSKFRNLHFQLQNYFDQQVDVNMEQKENEKYLFKNITDEEMDDLFLIARN